MYIGEFCPVGGDELIEIEHLFREAGRGETIGYSAVDDIVRRLSLQDEFQTFQLSNSTFDLDQKCTSQLEWYCVRPCSVPGHEILLCPNLTRSEEHAGKD